MNPLRYSGYCYDDETGLYYLNSRYYNPTWCRFISEDIRTLHEIENDNIEENLYLYCNNNPVNNFDITGHLTLPTLPTIIAGAIIGGLLSAVIDVFVQLTVGRKTIKSLDWGSIGIEFAAGALTGALIACNLPAPSTNLGRGIIGMLASLARSIRQGRFKTISGAFAAIGQAILSGAITVIIGSIRAKYGKPLNYNTVKQMIGKICINRAIRGGIRFSVGFGWFKLHIILN